ncbi:unnamed protein product [Ilex paraguariensis]|uniref:Uncharacterized protein n=1 Tax=Ilex paraguariensis TaxID=185542 RepID=A0ABC8S8N0_9AQUA
MKALKDGIDSEAQTNNQSMGCKIGYNRKDVSQHPQRGKLDRKIVVDDDGSKPGPEAYTKQAKARARRSKMALAVRLRQTTCLWAAGLVMIETMLPSMHNETNVMENSFDGLTDGQHGAEGSGIHKASKSMSEALKDGVGSEAQANNKSIGCKIAHNVANFMENSC